MQFNKKLIKNYNENIHQSQHLYEFKNDLFELMGIIAFNSVIGNDLATSRSMVITLQNLYFFIDSMEEKPTRISPLT